MKTKFFYFLACLLLSSVGAFAQSGNSEPLKGDLNNDGKVDAADIVVLVDLVMKSGGETGGDAKYYWYAGPDMLTSETVPGTNADNECGYGWHVIEGNPTSIETGELGTSDCEKINWVLAVPTKFGLNAISNGTVDLTSVYDVTTVTCADGVEYRVFTQVNSSKKTDVIFVKGNATSETKYYWYAGPDMLTSETVPGTNADNECGYGWHIIEGNPTSIETGELGTSDCEKINWVLAVPTKFGLNAISNGEDITDAYDVSTVTIADGVEYTVFKQISATKKTDVVFVKNNATSETKYYYYVGRQPVEGGIGTIDWINTNTAAFLASSVKIEKNSIAEVKAAVTGTVKVGSIDDGDALFILPTEVANAITSIKNTIGFEVTFDRCASVDGYTCVFIGEYTGTEIQVEF